MMTQMDTAVSGYKSDRGGPNASGLLQSDNPDPGKT